MKKFNQDSTSALSRFSRDKRQRTASTERVERSPRPQRDADNEGRAARAPRREDARRASFNPNFSSDNRLRGGEGRGYGERGMRDEKPRTGRSFGGARGEGRFEKPMRGEGNRFEGNRSEGRFEKPAKAGYGKKFNSDRTDRNDRSDRSYGDKGKRSFRNGDAPRSYPKYAAKQIGEMRLNRFLAQSGLCSRREADDFITAGLVTVNGQIVTELGTKVRSTDEVKFNDEKVQGEKKVYLVLNKPKGYVTSLEDPHADKTVMELVKDACSERIYPVGRLDKNSLGLLLFTNDGDVTRQLTHPSLEKKKIYQVTLDKALTRADMEQLTEGITLEDGEIFADEVAYVSESKKDVGIEIHSGRNRIVRRMFEHLGYAVQKLDRVYYAGITKKNLKRGQWRFLTREEVDRLKSGRYE
ncbi:MAG: rRNA pseudouridine synthase [Alistipes sp.]|nr:rRNA pseudouridine synthase [Alistipes sp.]